MSSTSARDWFIDLPIGILVGGILGGIVAVNLVIFLGPDSGYESSLADVFEHNTMIGIATIALLLTGPIIGVAAIRFLRSRA